MKPKLVTPDVAFRRGWNAALRQVERIGQKNNPEDVAILDADNYESMLISWKDLEQLRRK
jgi:hypothetical protein